MVAFYESYVNFISSYVDLVVDSSISTHLLTWNTFNHSDAFWFLFNTKRVINEVKHLL